MLFAWTLKDVLDMVVNALNGLMAWLCEIIYPWIASVYGLFMDLSSLVYTEEFNAIYNKISLLIGIFMLFRVTFWLIELLVNPDQITDKEKNPGNIVKKVLLVVILLATTPRIFKIAFSVQEKVIDNHLIEKILYVGNSNGLFDSDGNIDSTSLGNSMSADLFKNFFKVNPDIDSSSLKGSEKDNYDLCNAMSELLENNLRNNGRLNYLSGNTCLDDKIDDPLSVTEKKAKINIVQFDGLLAVLVGGFVLYMMLMYCISIGTRYIQLIFLQIIAPVPIMCYLTPKKDNMFSKWVKQCTTTYLDLFIRIVIINFVVILINMLFSSGGIMDSISVAADKTWIQIFLTLGLLTFAKKAPDLIQELLPKSVTKASGDFGLSWKKRTDAMVGGKFVYGVPKKAVGFAVAGTGQILKNTAVRAYNAGKHNLRQDMKLRDYNENAVSKLENEKKEYMKSREFQNLSAADKQKYISSMDAKINKLRNRSSRDIRREIKSENRNLKYSLNNITDKEERAKVMDQITANSDMIGHRNQATTFATSVLSGIATAGSAAIHEDGVRKIIKKSNEIGVQKIMKEQGWFRENPATFDNAVKRTVSVIQRKYGFETEGQAVQYAIDDLDAGIKKQKEDVTKLQEIEKAYSSNRTSVKNVEAEGAGDRDKDKMVKTFVGTDAAGNEIWEKFAFSTRIKEGRNAIERASEYYKQMSPDVGVKDMSTINDSDTSLAVLSSMVRTVMKNRKPNATEAEINSDTNSLMNEAKKCKTLDEAYNTVITRATQEMNSAEANYGKEQAAAGLLNLLFRNAGMNIEDAYFSQAIENEYDSLMRELNSNPSRYSDDVRNLQDKIVNFVNGKSRSDFNEESMCVLYKLWGDLKSALEREQAERARDTADANDALQAAQHEKEAFQRYNDNRVAIGNDKYGGGGK